MEERRSVSLQREKDWIRKAQATALVKGNDANCHRLSGQSSVVRPAPPAEPAPRPSCCLISVLELLGDNTNEMLRKCSKLLALG